MRKQIQILFAAFILIASSCSKNDIPAATATDPAAQLKKITDYSLKGTSVRVDVYREYDSLFTGYNPLYFKLTDTAAGKEVTNAGIDILPTMDMISMKHGCPTEQPVYADSLKLYKGAAAFSMASMDDMGMSWTLPTRIRLNGQTYNDTFPIAVKSAGTGKQFIRSATGSDGNIYYLVLVYPWQGEQKVGLNDLEVAVYKQNTLFDFPAADGLTLSFVPTMPSMGHSSPNNVDPIAIGNGHYSGMVNFTMTGDWQLDFTLNANNLQLAKDIYLNLLF